MLITNMIFSKVSHVHTRPSTMGNSNAGNTKLKSNLQYVKRFNTIFFWEEEVYVVYML